MSVANESTPRACGRACVALHRTCGGNEPATHPFRRMEKKDGADPRTAPMPEGTSLRCTPDGRVVTSVNCMLSLSQGKCCVVVLSIVAAILVLALSGSRAIQGSRPPWSTASPPRGDSGRLGAPLVPTGSTRGLSKIAQALPGVVLPPLADHFLCGENDPSPDELARKTLAIIVITWRAPRSLENSLRSWRSGGLLDIADELIMFINSPTARDRALAAEYGFSVLTTHEHHGNIMAGPALGYAVGNATSDYVLFLEKDFEMIGTRCVERPEV